jgi:myosin heavy subunit
MSNTGEDPMITIMKFEKELNKLRRENRRLTEENGRLNKLVEEMKNLDDDELLMVEKIQTKEIYGKAQKLKISDLQKETQKIRIEKDRLRVINKTNERVIKEKETEIITLRENLDRLKRQSHKVIYKTEFKDNPEQARVIRNLQEDIRILRNTRNQVKTVSGFKTFLMGSDANGRCTVTTRIQRKFAS